MTWLTEDPRTILAAGGLTLVVLLVFLLKTGRGVVVLAMAGVAVCMILAVLIDTLVVTDREQVEIIIAQGVEAAKQNDEAAILALISPAAEGMKDDARYWLRRIIIEDVNYGGVRIEEGPPSKLPTLVARLWFFAEGKLRRGDTIYNKVPGKLRIVFQKDGDKWYIVDYERL